MLRDRLALLEQEVAVYKKSCGELYLEIIKGTATSADTELYEFKKAELHSLITDLEIVREIIANGYQ